MIRESIVLAFGWKPKPIHPTKAPPLKPLNLRLLAVGMARINRSA